MSDDEELPLQEMASSIGLSTSSGSPWEAVFSVDLVVELGVLLVEVL